MALNKPIQVSRVLRTGILAVAAILYTAVVEPWPAVGDDTPVGEGPLVVRDVSVFVLSAYGAKLNDRDLFQSTLPGYSLSRRPSAPRESLNVAAPVGIMTFEGPPTEDLDVLLEFDAGRFLANWPPGQTRSKRLLWARLKLLREPSPPPAKMPTDHWLSPLREADRLYVSAGRRCDRFLLYDAEMQYVPHVTLERSEEGYTVTNRGSYAVHDVHIYRPKGPGQWGVAAVDHVEGVGKPEGNRQRQPEGAAKGIFNEPSPQPAKRAPQVQPSPAQPQEGEQAAEDDDTNVTPAPAATEVRPAGAGEQAAPADQPAESPPATKPAPKAARPGKSAIAPIAAKTPAAEALDDWRARLAELHLAKPEIEHVLGILQARALSDDGAMLVYRLDEAHLEELLPLEVTPFPDQLFRVALVIVQDADPDLQTRIDDLIAQLGHDRWKLREQAQSRLKQMGLAAKPKLEEALKSEDMEIVFRAEQLLESIQANP